MAKTPWPSHCADCQARLGQLHDEACDTEECPFCHGQLVACDCGADKIEALGEVVSRHGLSDDQFVRWKKILKEKGRVPWGQERKYEHMYE